MRDTKLRKKLFGEENVDCCNLYRYSVFTLSGDNGFLGQTYAKVQELEERVARLERKKKR